MATMRENERDIYCCTFERVTFFVAGKQSASAEVLGQPDGMHGKLLSVVPTLFYLCIPAVSRQKLQAIYILRTMCRGPKKQKSE